MRPRLPASASRKRRIQRVFWGLLTALTLGGLLIFLNVRSYSRLICPDVAAAPIRPVAIVLGAASVVLTDRVATGVELYKAGKVQKLLMTGDNSRDGYNEPAAMKQQALALGVPARDIVCDYAGFRTYDSLYRARDIFGVRSAILVTQGYHLPRALFLGRKLGLDVVGVDAAKRVYGGQIGFDLREIAATEIAWVQATVTHPRPKYLGKPEPLSVREESMHDANGFTQPRRPAAPLYHIGAQARPTRQRQRPRRAVGKNLEKTCVRLEKLGIRSVPCRRQGRNASLLPRADDGRSGCAGGGGWG